MPPEQAVAIGVPTPPAVSGSCTLKTCMYIYIYTILNTTTEKKSRETQPD